MSLSRINEAAPMTIGLVKAGRFSAAPFTVVDVGVSGGIARFWRQLQPSLRTFGFDPLVRECERLNREESNPEVRYFDYFVGDEGYDKLFPPALAQDPVQGWSNQPFERTSAARAKRLRAISSDQWYNNEDPDVVYSKRRTSLDAFFRERPRESVDFIKVDTDGQDYEVLCGARELLAGGGLLGLVVEAQFHGVSHAHSNLFSNIDRLLLQHGFSLFDLRLNRYTRAALPGHFEYGIPAQTLEGQLLWADALYLRDLSAPGYEERWGGARSMEKILKLACLFEIFGMPDCAAELLLARKAEVARDLDVPAALNQLARQLHPGRPSFDAVNRLFETSIEAFYPRTVSQMLRNRLPDGLRRTLSRIKRRLSR